MTDEKIVINRNQNINNGVANGENVEFISHILRFLHYLFWPNYKQGRPHASSKVTKMKRFLAFLYNSPIFSCKGGIGAMRIKRTVRNIIRAIERTLDQIFDPAFLKVFILGILTTIIAMVATWFLAAYLKDQITITHFDWQWMNDFFQWILGINWIFNIIFIFLMAIFFPPIATLFMSLYLDDIIDAVEDKYYPERKAGQKLGIGYLAYLGARLAVVIIVMNIIFIPLYLFFFWLPFVPLVIFYALNGYLLGWGYFEMVAVRHLGIRDAGRLRKSIRGQIILGGFIITLLYSFPVVNLLAPILGVAMLAHLFHLSLRQQEY